MTYLWQNVFKHQSCCIVGEKMRNDYKSVDDSGEFEKVDSAARELSDFLCTESKKVPYSCPNWNSEDGRIQRPYVQKSSLSDKYRMMPALDQTQFISEEDVPSDVDWSLPPVRNRRWTFAAAFLAAFSFSLYLQSTAHPRVEKSKTDYECTKKPVSKDYDPPAFRQGPKK